MYRAAGLREPIVIKPDFYTLDRATEVLAAPVETIRQIVLRRGLDAYVELNSTRADFSGDRYATLQGCRTSSDTAQEGSTAFATWRHNNGFAQDGHYYLSGWFKVRPDALHELLRGGRFQSPELWPADVEPWCSDDGKYAFFSPLGLDQADWQCHFEDLFFKVSDVDGLLQGGIGDEAHGSKGNATAAMRTDKEDNYLKIIARLWAISGLDAKPHTATSQLLNDPNFSGLAGPGASTIASALGRARGISIGQHPKFK